MRQSRASWIVALGFLALMMISVPSYADSITLSNANQSGFLGQTFTFSGTYFGQDVAGDVIHWTSATPCLTADPTGCVDDTAFIFGTPGIPGDLFDVLVAFGALPGTYNGQFSLVNDAGDSLATADFSLTVDRSVTETPEPGSLVLMGSGLIGAAGVLRRKLIA
ncbi:MAG: sorting protein [Candidatus Angelobacter sp.]|nr:sorting protein [Candidatus Angelobacter sp.]